MNKFIDIKKLNNYFLGLLYKNKKVFYGEHEDKIVLSDSYSLFIIDKEDLYINLSKCNFITNIYERFIPDDSNYLYTHITDTVLLDKKDKLRLLENENCKEIYLNDKYISFLKFRQCKSLSNNCPILFYDIDGNIISLILPMKLF